jgi:acetamidase/formamidase
MADHHVLAATPGTVHWGYFDPSLEPVLGVSSGDRVTVHTVSGGTDVTPEAGYQILPSHRAIQERVTRRMLPGHILTGPIAVEGAEPGDVLEVRILDIELTCDWGWSLIRPLGGTLPEDFPNFRLFTSRIDPARKEATLPWGAKIALSPFFGVMGTAPPPGWGVQTSLVPRAFGGNLDNKELVAGTTLFLPVFVEGALFSVGDGHAVQGDGEVCITAIETCLNGTFELVLHKGQSRPMPRAETPTHLVTMGLDHDLDDAAKQALREMIALVCERTTLDAEEAYVLCSLAADLHVTQTVNQVKGVHAMLPRAILDAQPTTRR